MERCDVVLLETRPQRKADALIALRGSPHADIMDQNVAVVVALVSLGLLLLLIVGLFIMIDSFDQQPSASSALASMGGATASAANGGASKPAKKRVYTQGVRLEDLLTWPAADAAEALAAYLQQMEGDEREALFSHLPQATNCVLGLDQHVPGSPRGWLNEQSRLLSEPNRNVRGAQALAQKLLDLVAAPDRTGGTVALVGGSLGAVGGGSTGGGGGGVTAKPVPGHLYTKLIDAGRGPEGGMRYTFFSKHLPAPARVALANGQPKLVPALFAARLPNRLGLQGGGSPAGAVPGRIPEPINLVLAAWEYFLFCFCLWPLTDAGERAMDVVTPPAAALPGAAMLASMGGSKPQPGEPLYLTILGSYLRALVPVRAPLPADGSGPGWLLLSALSQFWLCQNAEPLVAAQLAAQTPFADTKASVLTALSFVVRHLNAHEVARLADPASALAASASAHAAFRAPFYHFFDKQLDSLPEISARVAHLIRLFTHYLQPWRPEGQQPGDKAGDKGGASAGGASVIGGAMATAAGAAAPAAAGSAVTGATSDSAAAPAATAASSAVVATMAAEAAAAWRWAGFVRGNYLLYVRLLVSVSREVKLGRFRFNEKRDVVMLREAMALFSSPHVLLLLRQMGEALELLLLGGSNAAVGGVGSAALGSASSGASASAAAGGPGGLRDVLVGQLAQLEGRDPSRWRATCDAYLPAKVYAALDGMDRELQTKLDEHRKRQREKNFFESAGDSSSKSYVTVVEELRRFAQRCMRELQPAGQPSARPVVAVEKHKSDIRPAFTLLRPASDGYGGYENAPLTDEQRRMLGKGHARCSRLGVAYRATPRRPVRPVGEGELPILVDLSERLAARLPLAARRLGLHPRILASVPSLCLCTIYAILIAIRPTRPAASSVAPAVATPIATPATPDAAGLTAVHPAAVEAAALRAQQQQPDRQPDLSLSDALLTALWWLLLLPTLAVGVLYLRHVMRRYRPVKAASAESWVPWFAEQLARGTPEEELKEYMRRALPEGAFAPEDDAAAIERMLARARERLQYE